MSSLRRQIRFTLVLGWVALVAGIFTLLALTDIAHGEQDLTLEWRIVRVCTLIIGLFLSTTLFTLRRTLKSLDL